MRTQSLLVAAFTLICGCSVERNGASTRDSGTAAELPKSPAADSGATTSPAPGDAWTVTPAGIGPVRVGMSVDDLRRATEVTLPAGGLASCTYVRPSGAPPGVSVMLASGQVARIDVDSSGVRTDAGISVGDSAARIGQAYAGRVTTRPHKYVSGGEYLIVKAASPADSTLRIVFESEGGRITRLRSGRAPEVEWVERCG